MLGWLGAPSGRRCRGRAGWGVRLCLVAAQFWFGHVSIFEHEQAGSAQPGLLCVLNGWTVSFICYRDKRVRVSFKKKSKN